MAKKKIDLNKFEEDKYGWYYWTLINDYGEHANPYDLNHAHKQSEYKKKKIYVAHKKGLIYENTVVK